MRAAGDMRAVRGVRAKRRADSERRAGGGGMRSSRGDCPPRGDRGSAPAVRAARACANAYARRPNDVESDTRTRHLLRRSGTAPAETACPRAARRGERPARSRSELAPRRHTPHPACASEASRARCPRAASAVCSSVLLLAILPWCTRCRHRLRARLGLKHRCNIAPTGRRIIIAAVQQPCMCSQAGRANIQHRTCNHLETLLLNKACTLMRTACGTRLRRPRGIRSSPCASAAAALERRAVCRASPVRHATLS